MAKAIVIGSGIAGLAGALRLRAKGYEVDVFEANDYAGGKLHAFESSGYRFDYGPSLFTMPQFVDELFDLFQENPRDYLNYSRKDSTCNYFWEDGTTFTAPASPEKFIAQASSTFNEPVTHLEKYFTNSSKKYDLTAPLFMERSLHKADTYLNKQALKGVLNIGKLEINKTLHDVNQKFSSPKLTQLFNRYATYNGSNPYSTPGIMSLIPQLEMRFGTYYPHGGMHEISQSLFRLAKSKGVKFRFNSKVTRITHQKGLASGLEVENKHYAADLIVCNMDVFSAYKNLLKDVEQPKRILRQERSSSALIFYWGIDQVFEELSLHNIFFSNDYKGEFDAIFKRHQLHSDPTVYINITSKEENGHAPNGGENWFVMINVPSNKGQDWEKFKVQAKQNILKKLSRILNKEIEPMIVTEDILDPVRIEYDTSSNEGSLYGTSSNSKFAAFLRHPNFSSSLKNLYFCGGSAHPGGGIPLCLLSAKIVANLIPEA